VLILSERVHVTLTGGQNLWPVNNPVITTRADYIDALPVPAEVWLFVAGFGWNRETEGYVNHGEAINEKEFQDLPGWGVYGCIWSTGISR
jgi:hypothetical protein